MINDNMYNLAQRLFPICRSLTGNGTRETLRILNEISKLNIIKFKSGKKVYDWTIPQEWNINDAYILDSSGKKVVSFEDSNLHIVGYSEPFNGKMKLEELKKHIFTIPECPDIIPYITSYYKRMWGFCMRYKDLNNLKDGEYNVVVDSSLTNGYMDIGEILIKGRSKKEILISCNICHPSLANNELSGMIVSIFLAKYLKGRDNFYTYRIVFLPETIGSIAYIHKNFKKLRKNVIAGLQLTCIGDKGKFSYLLSRKENSLIDRIVLHVLKHTEKEFNIYPYSGRGSDERQYCSPNVDLPVGSLMRSKYHEYKEYHTSADDMSFISGENLYESFQKCIIIFRAMENNRTYVSNIKCEPHFQKYDMYPHLSTKSTIGVVKLMKNVLTYCDGEHDLLSIAEKLNVSIFELYDIINKFVEKKIIRAT